VALKILPDAFASDPDRLARFKREAQILASLDHPIIAAIEEADGTRALVLELVEDPTLADLISKGPIPLDEALPIAKQIAEALEAAHETGVMHRDLLKPANIKVRKDGTVKVLDFGLAKAFDPNPEGDPSQGMWSEQAYARVLPQVVGVERPGDLIRLARDFPIEAKLDRVTDRVGEGADHSLGRGRASPGFHPGLTVF